MVLLLWHSLSGRQLTNHIERERLMDINVLAGEEPWAGWGNQGRLLRGGDISAGS